VHKHRRVALYVVMIIFLELCVHIPSLFLVEYMPSVMASNNTDDPYIACGIWFQKTVLSRRTHIWTETLVDSLIPSLLLLFLTWTILLTLRKAKQSRLSLRSHSSIKSSGDGKKGDEGQRVMLSSIPSSQRLSNGEAAFDKIDRESRRASWLIFAVAALIFTHERPMSILNIYNLAKYNQRTLPVVLYGCWA